MTDVADDWPSEMEAALDGGQFFRLKLRFEFDEDRPDQHNGWLDLRCRIELAAWGFTAEVDQFTDLRQIRDLRDAAGAVAAFEIAKGEASVIGAGEHEGLKIQLESARGGLVLRYGISDWHYGGPGAESLASVRLTGEAFVSRDQLAVFRERLTSTIRFIEACVDPPS